MHRLASEGRRVVIAAPYGRDAENVSALLNDRGYDTIIASSLPNIVAAFDPLLGAVLLTEEILAGDLTDLRRVMAGQEAWSNPPFILLSGRQTSIVGADAVRRSLAAFVTNLVVLERPMGAVSLISAVDSALRARQKQFELRDQIAQLAASERALAESEAELRLIADSLPVLIGFIGLDYRYRFANRAFEDWLYRPVEEIIGKTVTELAGEEAFALRKPAMDIALSGHPSRMELTWPHRDGRRREADVRYIPRFDSTGAVEGFHVFVSDITDRRETAETLERLVLERTSALQDEVENRARVEAALRQSQKMETVGQLTGGIAHDFNNMLTGVIGAMDILKRRLAAGRYEDTERFMDAAIASANRAAALTHRLLAFARRQPLDPHPVAVNDLIGDMEDLLRRTLGEHVRLSVDLASDLWPTLSDSNQLESAVLNLAINARDAMPDGGKLNIKTRNEVLAGSDDEADPLPPGDYIMIAVSDSGIGISPELIAKVFEPFFTTKPLGEGTGLGLSMIYGFVKQSGGHARIESAVGAGTTVHLYLPRHQGVVEARRAPVAAQAPKGRGETVLLVEDDASVRLLIGEVLRELGYACIEAPDGQIALSTLNSKTRLDLMVTDIGLPGINGRQLADMARRDRPDLKILFVTGYAERALGQERFLEDGMQMVTKPFTLDALAKKIREMIAD